jgi:hypothetical protein
MFKIGRTKQNKPCVIIEPYKYRRDKILATKEITWRCMGSSCNASIRTNASSTVILLHKNSHSGHHPPSSLASSSEERAGSPEVQSFLSQNLVAIEKSVQTPPMSRLTNHVNDLSTTTSRTSPSRLSQSLDSGGGLDSPEDVM